MGTDVEFLIDLLGRSRKVGKRNVAIAVAKVGYVHVRVPERQMEDQRRNSRTVIVTLQPQLVTQPAIAALGYKLADLDPERTIVVAELAVPQSWVFPAHMPALRMIAMLASDGTRGQAVAAVDLCERPI